jgi:hypothetical protein
MSLAIHVRGIREVLQGERFKPQGTRMSLSNQDVGLRVSNYPRQGDTRGSPSGTIQVVSDPHDTEGV